MRRSSKTKIRGGFQSLSLVKKIYLILVIISLFTANMTSALTTQKFSEPSSGVSFFQLFKNWNPGYHRGNFNDFSNVDHQREYIRGTDLLAFISKNKLVIINYKTLKVYREFLQMSVSAFCILQGTNNVFYSYSQSNIYYIILENYVTGVVETSPTTVPLYIKMLTCDGNFAFAYDIDNRKLGFIQISALNVRAITNEILPLGENLNGNIIAEHKSDFSGKLFASKNSVVQVYEENFSDSSLPKEYTIVFSDGVSLENYNVKRLVRIPGANIILALHINSSNENALSTINISAACSSPLDNNLRESGIVLKKIKIPSNIIANAITQNSMIALTGSNQIAFGVNSENFIYIYDWVQDTVVLKITTDEPIAALMELPGNLIWAQGNGDTKAFVYSLKDTNIVESSNKVDNLLNGCVINRVGSLQQVAFVRDNIFLVTKILTTDEEIRIKNFDSLPITSIMHIQNVNEVFQETNNNDYMVVLVNANNLFLYNYRYGTVKQSSVIPITFDATSLIYAIPTVGTYFLLSQKGTEFYIINVKTWSIFKTLHTLISRSVVSHWWISNDAAKTFGSNYVFVERSGSTNYIVLRKLSESMDGNSLAELTLGIGDVADFVTALDNTNIYFINKSGPTITLKFWNGSSGSSADVNTWTDKGEVIGLGSYGTFVIVYFKLNNEGSFVIIDTAKSNSDTNYSIDIRSSKRFLFQQKVENSQNGYYFIVYDSWLNYYEFSPTKNPCVDGYENVNGKCYKTCSDNRLFDKLNDCVPNCPTGYDPVTGPLGNVCAFNQNTGTSSVTDCINNGGLSNYCVKCANGKYLLIDDRDNKMLYSSCVDCTDSGQTKYAPIISASPRTDGIGFCIQTSSTPVPYCLEYKVGSNYCTKCDNGLFLKSSAGNENYDQCVYFSTAYSSVYIAKTYTGDGTDVLKKCGLGVSNCNKCRAADCIECLAEFYKNQAEPNQIAGNCLSKINCIDPTLWGYLEFGEIDTPTKLGRCITCDYITKDCLKCENQVDCDQCRANLWKTYADGVWATKDSTTKFTCTACGSSYVKVPPSTTDGTGSCRSCNDIISNCYICNADGTSCSQCKSNYYLYDEDDNDGLYTCNKCFETDAMYVDTGDASICKKCSTKYPNQGAVTCNKDTITKCPVGKYLMSSDADDTSYDICTDCSGDTKAVNNDDLNGTEICKPCGWWISGCNNCASKIVCILCDLSGLNYFLDKRMTPGVTCVKCTNEGEYHDDITLPNPECKYCQLECTMCTDVDQCSACAANYYLRDWTVFNGKSACIKCDQDGEYVDTNCKQCSTKYANQSPVTCTNDTITKCPATKYRMSSDSDNTTYELCTDCSAASEAENSVDLASGTEICKLCGWWISGCSNCDSKTVCILCNSSDAGGLKYLDKRALPGINCVKCVTDGEYQDDTPPAECKNCPTGCTKCTGVDQCSACEADYYLRDWTIVNGKSACIKCDQDGEYVDTNCKQCSTKYANQSPVTCTKDTITKCQTNNFRMSSDSDNTTYELCTYCSAASEAENSVDLASGTEICKLCGWWIPGCINCDSKTVCILCNSSDAGGLKYLDKRALPGINCVKCVTDGEYQDDTAPAECKNCQPECTKCTGIDQCSACATSYYLRDWTIVDSKSACIKCDQDGEYVDINCKQCSTKYANQSPVTCTKDTITKCQTNKYRMSSDSDNITYELCTDCSAASEAENNVDLASGTEICKTCGWWISGCINCDSKTVCTLCNSSDSGGLKYLDKRATPGINCVKCVTDGEYQDDNAPAECKNCPTGCTKCTGVDQCSACAINYYLRDWTIVDSKSACIKCDQRGEVIDTTPTPNVCRKCSEIFNDVNAAQCSLTDIFECTVGGVRRLLESSEDKSHPRILSQSQLLRKYVDVGNSVYHYTACITDVACEVLSGYGIDDNTNKTGTCKPCGQLSTNCAVCDGSKSASTFECIKCTGDFRVDSNSKASCITCGDGYYKGDNTGIKTAENYCKKCATDCTKCTSDTLCTACDTGYYLKAVDTSGFQLCYYCDDQIVNCVNCELNSGSTAVKCTKCAATYYLFSSGLGYYDNCVVCTPSDNIGKQYGLADGSGVCDACSNHIDKCLDCNSALLCTKCENDIILYLFDSTQNSINYDYCVSCTEPTRYIHEAITDGTGICKLCSENISNCVECSSGTVCTKCQQNYYLYSQCSETFVECVACTDDITMYIDPSNNATNGTGVCKSCASNITDCVECSSGTTCTKCKTNYYLYVVGANTGCTSCTNEATKYVDLDHTETDGTGHCKLCSSSTCPVNLSHCNKCNNDYTDCDECDASYYLVAEDLDSLGAESCSDCIAVDRFLDVSTCHLCKAYWGTNRKCIECNISKCTKCLSSHSNLYYLFDDSNGANYNKCVDCSGNAFYLVDSTVVDGTGVCKSCADNITDCVECSSGTTCTKCKANYYLYVVGANTSCVICTDDATKYVDRDHIETDGTGHCKLCSSATFPVNLSHCNKCNNNDTDCDECEASYYLVAEDLNFLDREICSECVTHDRFLDESTCHLCKAYWGINRRCIECDINKCSKCFSSQSDLYYLFDDSNGTNYNECVQCSGRDYYIVDLSITDGTGVCKSCKSNITDCEECSSGTICTKCKANYYLYVDVANTLCAICTDDATKYVDLDHNEIDGTGQCKLCSTTTYPINLSNCNKCNNDYTSCRECMAGFYLVAGSDQKDVCKGCSIIQNCIECSTGSTCTKCKSNYFLYEVGSKQGCDSCTDDDTKFVDPDHSETDGTGKCKLCSTVTFPVNLSNCRKCFNDLKSCRECEDGFYLVAEDLSFPNQKSCTKCITGCTQCESALVCTACQTEGIIYYKYEPTQSSPNFKGKCNICLEADALYVDTDDSNICKKCSTKFPNQGALACTKDTITKCPATKYLMSSGNDDLNYDLCTDCAAASEAENIIDLITGTEKCKTCGWWIEGCTNCYSKTICTLCDSNDEGNLKYLDKRTLTYVTCVKCTEDGEYQDNTAQECKSCQIECVKCTGIDQCFACATNYYLRDWTMLKGASKCIKCSENGEYIDSNCKLCITKYPNQSAVTCNRDTITKCPAGLYRKSSDTDDSTYDLCTDCSASSVAENTIDTTSGTEICKDCGWWIGGCSECESKTVCTLCNSADPDGRKYLDKRHLTGVNCVKCIFEGEYQDNSTTTAECKNCQIECTKCTGVDQCSACAANYYLKDWNMSNSVSKCVKCVDDGEYVDTNCKLCKTRYPNQSAVTCNKDTITKCPAGLYLKSSDKDDSTFELCIDCSAASEAENKIDLISGTEICKNCGWWIGGCSECVSKTVCTQCNADDAELRKYLDKRNLSAVNCTKCSNDGEFQDNSIPAECKNCQIGCNKCIGVDLCSTCFTGYYLRDWTTSNNGYSLCIKCDQLGQVIVLGICKKCNTYIKNCAKCSPNLVCSLCETNFYLKKEETQVICSLCNLNGFFIDTVNNSCKACSEVFDGCNLCDSNKCLECLNSNYILKGGSCWKCKDVWADSITCNSDKILTCQTGYCLFFESPDSSGLCKNKEEISNSKTSIITSNNNESTCIRCDDVQKFPNSLFCNNEEIFQCQENFFKFYSNTSSLVYEHCIPCDQEGLVRVLNFKDGSGICANCSYVNLKLQFVSDANLTVLCEKIKVEEEFFSVIDNTTSIMINNNCTNDQSSSCASLNQTKFKTEEKYYNETLQKFDSFLDDNTTIVTKNKTFIILNYTVQLTQSTFIKEDTKYVAAVNIFEKLIIRNVNSDKEELIKSLNLTTILKKVLSDVENLDLNNKKSLSSRLSLIRSGLIQNVTKYINIDFDSYYFRYSVLHLMRGLLNRTFDDENLELLYNEKLQNNGQQMIVALQIWEFDPFAIETEYFENEGKFMHRSKVISIDFFYSSGTLFKKKKFTIGENFMLVFDKQEITSDLVCMRYSEDEGWKNDNVSTIQERSKLICASSDSLDLVLNKITIYSGDDSTSTLIIVLPIVFSIIGLVLLILIIVLIKRRKKSGDSKNKYHVSDKIDKNNEEFENVI